MALARSIAEQLGPFRAGALTFLTAGAMLFTGRFLLEKNTGKPKRWSLLYVFGCGFLFVFYMISLYFALGQAEGRADAIVVGLVNYLWPTLTLVFSIFVLGHRPRWGWLFSGTILALSGVFLAMTPEMTLSFSGWMAQLSRHPLTYGSGFLAAVCWALYSTLSRRWGQSDSSTAVPFFVLATGLVFLLIDFLRPHASNWHSKVMFEISALAVATALGYLFWDRAMRTGNLIIVVAGSYLTPFFSTLISCLYLHIVPSAQLWFGCLLIVTGSLLSAYSIGPAAPNR